MKPWQYAALIITAPLAPFIFYIYHHKLSLSASQTDWGSFGSFMGGVSGPMIAGITLIFLIDSFLKQSRTSALQYFFFQMQHHSEYVKGYTTQYSNSYSGIEYLNYLWKTIAQAQRELSDEEIMRLTQFNLTEISPVISSIKSIIKSLDEEISLNKSEKHNNANLFYSRLTSVEIKLVLALSYFDPELNHFIKKYPGILSVQISKPEEEKELICYMLARHTA